MYINLKVFNKYIKGVFNMKNNLKFLTLTLLILLAQSSLATSYEAGPGSTATGANSVAVGLDNTASGQRSSAFGYKNKASGEDSSAVGNENKASGKKSSAFGYETYVSGEGSGAFGRGEYRSGDHLYKIEGNNSWAIGSHNSIAAGSDNNHILGNNVSIGAGITNSVVLGNDSTVSSSNEVSVGSATLKRKITNVADGEVSATSTDAVNGRQLYNAMQNSGTVGIQNLRKGVENLRKEVRDAKDEMRGIGSLSAALSALHPMQYDPQAPNQIMAGVGTYRDKHAIAVGLTHYFKENVMMTAGVALSNERKTNAMANVALTWKLGKGGSSSATNTPAYVMRDEMNRLAKENNQLKAQVNSQNERIKSLEKKLEMILNKK